MKLMLIMLVTFGAFGASGAVEYKAKNKVKNKPKYSKGDCVYETLSHYVLHVNDVKKSKYYVEACSMFLGCLDEVHDVVEFDSDKNKRKCL